MYTIVMNDDKSLSKREIAKIYQNESLVDKIRFLIPFEYGGQSLSKFVVRLSYIDHGNVCHTEKLSMASETYKDAMLCYYLPVDSELAKFAGSISVHLVLSREDYINKKHYILHTSDTEITIEPVKCCYQTKVNDFVTPDTPEDDDDTEGFEVVEF